MSKECKPYWEKSVIPGDVPGAFAANQEDQQLHRKDDSMSLKNSFSSPAFTDSWKSQFQEWYSATFHVVFSRLQQRFGDAQLADEVTGDALAKGFKQGSLKPGYFCSQTHFIRWCRRVAQNLAVDHLRIRSRQQSLNGLEIPTKGNGPLKELEDKEMSAQKELDLSRLQQALEQLLPEEREALKGYYFQDLTDQEVERQFFPQSQAGSKALGLRAHRLRQKALGKMRGLLLEAGVDPNLY